MGNSSSYLLEAHSAADAKVRRRGWGDDIGLRKEDERGDEEEEEAAVRVVREEDGEVFEFLGEVYVEDLMFGFPGLYVFPTYTPYTPPHSPTHDAAYNKLDDRPLPPRTLLHLGHSYSLRPLPPHHHHHHHLSDDLAL